MQVDRSRVGRHLRRQIHHLLFRPFTGVGRRVKIDRIDLDAPLGDHPPGHRRINTAGQKQHRLAACAYRHTARPRNDLGIDIDLVPNLHMQKNIRLMHVHSAVRKTDGRIYVDAVSDFDYDETVQHLQKVFGISVTPSGSPHMTGCPQ